MRSRDWVEQFLAVLHEIDKAKYYGSNKLALARVLLLVGLTGADDWRYDYQCHAYIVRWRWLCNGTEVQFMQMYSEEILIDMRMTLMKFAEITEHQCMSEWVRFRYNGPKEGQ